MVLFGKMRWKIEHRVSQSVGFSIHHFNMELLNVNVHSGMSGGKLLSSLPNVTESDL